MEINELKSKIDSLNTRLARVNMLRNQNIGKRETLISQCNQLYKKYYETYGIELTDENLDSEIARVMADKEKEATLIESVLKAIDECNYSKANALMGVEYDSGSAYERTSTDEIVNKKQEIMSRDFNKQVETAQPSQTVQPSQTTVFQSSGAVSPLQTPVSPLQTPISQVAEPTVSPQINPVELTAPPQINTVSPVGSTISPQASPTEKGVFSSTAQVSQLSNNSVLSTEDEEEDLPVPPPSTFGKSVHTGNNIMSGFKKSGSGVFGFNGVSPVPTPKKDISKASFEAMFGGTQFSGK